MSLFPPRTIAAVRAWATAPSGTALPLLLCAHARPSDITHLVDAALMGSGQSSQTFAVYRGMALPHLGGLAVAVFAGAAPSTDTADICTHLLAQHAEGDTRLVLHIDAPDVPHDTQAWTWLSNRCIRIGL